MGQFQIVMVSSRDNINCGGKKMFYLSPTVGVKCSYQDSEHGRLYRWKDRSGDFNAPNDLNQIPCCSKRGKSTCKRLSDV